MVTFYTNAFECIGSSNLDAVYYDAKTNQLFVEFRNGSIAGYSNVPQNLYNSLYASSSRGSFYNKHIKGHFPGIDTKYITTFEERTSVAPATPSSRRYIVKGTVEVSIEVDASSVEDALAKARVQQKSLVPTEVTVPLV